MNSFRKLITVSIIIAAFTFAGCQEQGSMEKAGEKIDNAAKKTADVAKEVVDDVKDAVN